MIRYDIASTTVPLRPVMDKSQRSISTYSVAGDLFAEIDSLISKGLTTPEQLFGSFIGQPISKAEAETNPATPKALHPSMSAGKTGQYSASSTGMRDLGAAFHQFQAAQPKQPQAVSTTAETVTGGIRHSPTSAKTQVSPIQPVSSSDRTVVHDTQVASGTPSSSPQVINNRQPQAGGGQVSWNSGHVKAAHDALAAHYQHEHNRVISTKGPQAAQEAGLSEMANQHRAASASLHANGVVATPEHHSDVMGALRTGQAGPVTTDVPALNQEFAHQSLSSIPGHGTTGGIRPTGTVIPPQAGGSSAEDRSVHSQATSGGIPSKSPTMRFRPEPLLVPGSQEEAPDFTTGRYTVNRSLVAITNLMKSAADINKDYGYGGKAESEELSKESAVKLPDLLAGNRQEKRLTRDRSSRKRRQTEEQLGVSAEKSLFAVIDLLKSVSQSTKSLKLINDLLR